MAIVESVGTVDGKPAKVRYDSERHQTHVYWGGLGCPDGTGHNHATILDASPNEFHYLRVGNELVINHGYKPGSTESRRQDTKFYLAKILADAWRRNKKWWGIG